MASTSSSPWRHRNDSEGSDPVSAINSYSSVRMEVSGLGALHWDLEQVFRAYEVGSEKEPAAKGTKVGHLHLYVGDLAKAQAFYKSLGMEPARWWPPMQVADLGAGGPFKHCIAINTWQGLGAPPSPAGSARMRHFEMRFDSQERLRAALAANPTAGSQTKHSFGQRTGDRSDTFIHLRSSLHFASDFAAPCIRAIGPQSFRTA
jgi:catechol-2,3-dioxygenase